MQPDDFFAVPPADRAALLKRAIGLEHRRHFERNVAYRQTLAARGVGVQVDEGSLARILRPAALTFKSYADRLGPFPQDHPLEFVRWLSEQVSIPLPLDLARSLRGRYRTMEACLCAIERTFADSGLEIVTSTGTSGLASIVARNAATVDLAVRAFFDGIGRAWGISRGTDLIFVMPERSRVAMARIAQIGTRALDWEAAGAVHYTVPFSATPDRLRIRAGRTFRPGLTGVIERRALHPFAAWAADHLAGARIVAATAARLRESAHAGRPLMLLGGLVQLHAVARHVRLRLPRGSRVATGGGMKEQYPVGPAGIRRDLHDAFGGTPVSDVYGMAEANWAAFECPEGSYHIPPWVYAVVTDEDDQVVEGPDVVGRLAFFDPIGGGDVVPPFFQTADRVRLVGGGDSYNPARACACGYETAHIAGAIVRVDLIEEAGCAAQV